MSITVRLIFWGLIGFVPNPQGHDGLAALLVDTQAAQTAPSRCGVPVHFGALYLLDGQCEGDCRRIPTGKETAAAQMGFKSPRGEKLPLAWLLDKEDVTVVGNQEDDKIQVRKPWWWWPFSKICPKSERQSGFFSWVPSMDMLTGGHGRIKDSCLRADKDCPLNARFLAPGGKLGACHLLHGSDPQDATDPRHRNVDIFQYTSSSPNQPAPERAVADASLVELEVKGDSVLLLSKGLPGRSTSSAWARLKPDANGKLTLVVANFPRHNAGNPPNCPPHSDLLFTLLADPGTPRLTRTMTGKINRVFPGSCEPEAQILAEIIEKGVSHEHPHAGTACDGMTYP
ncbi:MAG TPA: hypothetical protein VFR03_08450 [Thermoanaerobaculia bacterium]|nr:hypothetical protein [Thermoanaerobaculia bacterium]